MDGRNSGGTVTSVLHIDFETRSTLDLKEVGLDNYARHPTTDAWCMAYAFGGGATSLVAKYFLDRDDSLRLVFEHVQSGDTVVAHNVAFELAIWNNIMVPRYGWPMLRPEQCECTMAMAYAMSLPGALDNAAAAVGIDHRKDQAGYRLMLQMCRPRDIKPDGTIVWWDDEERRQKLYAYCRQDVVVERELHKRLMPLSAKERRVWLLDYKINQRGVQVDIPTVKKAIEVVQSEQDRLNERLRRATGNFVGFTTETARLAQWVRSRGVDIPGVAKADVLDALELRDLPGDVRQALLIRQEAGRSSTAKLRKFIDVASADGRVRNMFQYHGAAPGRWTGRGVQLHNLPRQKLKPKQIEAALRALPDADLIDTLFGPPMGVISEALRGMLIAKPGHELLTSDFSNIEGRGVAWQAGEEWKLEAFRRQDAKTGPEIYIIAAVKIYHCDPSTLNKNSPERQIGKVSELACGYQGGVGAFQQLAKTYLVKVPDAEAEVIKTAWRAAHPKIVQYWYDLERAAMAAVLDRGKTFAAGPVGRQVKYRVAGSFLWCLLPSGRTLCYPYPRIVEIDTPWGEKKDALTYMTEVDPSRKAREKIVDDPAAQGRWQRIATYGGKLLQNNTEAICRDLLVDAMLRADEREWRIVLHAHDELVCEEPEMTRYKDDLDKLMEEVPAWAAGLPVKADGWIGKRYRK
jgi:DNA polymerase bacteriophage-type